MEVNYEQFVQELTKCVQDMTNGKKVSKSFKLIDIYCGFYMNVRIECCDNIYFIYVNDVEVYYTTKRYCDFKGESEVYKILDILSAVKHFVK